MAASLALTAAAAAAAEQGSAGLPQFDASRWPGQMVWILLIFGLMFLLFSRVFVPRVGGTMDLREDRISGDIGEARRLRDQAEAQAAQAAAETAHARAQAQKLALDAKARAQADAAARDAVEQARIDEHVAKAEASVVAARDQAMTHVRDIAADTAAAIIAKLTGAAASADEIRAAVAGKA